jgi:hypothetical protein
LAWVAKWESQRRSERLKAKAESKRNRAAAGGGRTVWGRGRLPTYDDEARVLALVASGTPYRKVRREVGFSISTISRIVRSGSCPPRRLLGVSANTESDIDFDRGRGPTQARPHLHALRTPDQRGETEASGWAEGV